MIIWLASYPRSGNTLLRTVLRHCFEQETYSLYDDRLDIGAHDETRSVVGHRDMGSDTKCFLDSARKSHDPVFVKTHELPGAAAHDDDSKAIYVVREGLSTCVSYARYLCNFVEPTSLQDVVVGCVTFGSWSEHVEAWCARPSTLVLAYDDLVRNLDDALTAISRFIELPVASRALPSFDDLHHINPKFFRSGSNRQNVGEAAPAHRMLFEILHGKTNRAHGHLPHASLDQDVAASAEMLRAGLTKIMARSRATFAGYLQADADREQRAEQVEQLSAQLRTAQTDADGRLKQIESLSAYANQLEARLSTAEQASAANLAAVQQAHADLQRLESDLAALYSAYAESEEDRSARLDRIQALEARLREVDEDRASRLAQIVSLTERLRECESDRARQLADIENLSTQLQKSELDRSARLQSSDFLSLKLAESEQDREHRLHCLQETQANLEECEHDRVRSLRDNETLASLLVESERDRHARLVEMQRLQKKLEESELDRDRRLASINELARLLNESEMDRSQRLESIEALSAQLEQSELDKEAHLVRIRQIEAALEASELRLAQQLGLNQHFAGRLQELELERDKGLAKIQELSESLLELDRDRALLVVNLQSTADDIKALRAAVAHCQERQRENERALKTQHQVIDDAAALAHSLCGRPMMRLLAALGSKELHALEGVLQKAADRKGG